MKSDFNLNRRESTDRPIGLSADTAVAGGHACSSESPGNGSRRTVLQGIAGLLSATGRGGLINGYTKHNWYAFFASRRVRLALRNLSCAALAALLSMTMCGAVELAAASPASAAPTTLASDPDLLSNGSFGDGSFQGWNTLPANGGTVNVAAYNNGTAYDGSWYGETNTSTPNGSVYQDVSVAATPGQSYTFSVWIRSKSGTPVSGNLTLWGLGGTTEHATTPFTVGSAWTLVTAPLDVTQAGHTDLRAQIYELTTGQNYDLDGASLPQVITNYVPPAVTALAAESAHSYIADTGPGQSILGNGEFGTVAYTTQTIEWQYPPSEGQSGFTFALKNAQNGANVRVGGPIPITGADLCGYVASVGSNTFAVACILTPNTNYDVTVTPNFPNSPGTNFAPLSQTTPFTTPPVSIAVIPNIVGQPLSQAYDLLTNVLLNVSEWGPSCLKNCNSIATGWNTDITKPQNTGGGEIATSYPPGTEGNVDLYFRNSSSTYGSCTQSFVCAQVDVTNHLTSGTPIDLYVAVNGGTPTKETTIQAGETYPYTLAQNDYYAIYPVDPNLGGCSDADASMVSECSEDPTGFQGDSSAGTYPLDVNVDDG